MNCVCRQSLSLFVVHLKHIFTLCTLEMTQASTGDIVLGTRRKQRTFLQLSRIMDPNYFGPFHTRVFRTNLRTLTWSHGLLMDLTEGSECDLFPGMELRRSSCAVHEVLQISRVSLPRTYVGWT